MLFFGFLMVSTVLAMKPDLTDDQVVACIYNGLMSSLEVQNKNDPLRFGCSEVSVDHVRRSLDLGSRKIEIFRNGWYDLQDYSINEIDLHGNKIVEITSEIFNDLPANVKLVNLTSNKIKYLKKGMIKNDHLNTLDLTLNDLHEIETEALKMMKLKGSLLLFGNKLIDTKFTATLPRDLMELDLKANAITEISDGSFAKLGKLQTLSLDRNKINAIPKQAFKDLKRLEYLDLSNNAIRKIETRSFRALRNLRQLLLNHNKITVVPQRAFKDVANLQYLTLSSNAIEKVETQTFWGLRELRHLLFNFNKISKIPRQAFKDLTNLEYLDLSHNAIEHVQNSPFSRLGKLKTLWLNHNAITVISQQAFQGLTNLEILVLSENPIQRIKPGSFDLMPLLDTIQYNGSEYSKSVKLNNMLIPKDTVFLKIFKKNDMSV